MTKIPLFLRPLTAFSEEEEAEEVAEIVRLVEAAMDAADVGRQEGQHPALREVTKPTANPFYMHSKNM